MNRDRGVPAGAAGAGAGAGAGGLDHDTMNAIANSPQIQRIRQAVQENPGLIQPLLQQIAQQNPGLAQVINENPQALYELLGIGAEDDDVEYHGPQVMQVNLTQEEAAAVERVSTFLLPAVTALTRSSSSSALSARWSSRLSSCATRTRSLPPTSCSRVQRRTSRCSTEGGVMDGM